MPDNTITKNNIKLDNRYVVPHNTKLFVKYQAHSTVEICSQSTATKYIFKIY